VSLDALHELTVSALRALADSLRDGALSRGLSDRPLQQIVTSANFTESAQQRNMEAGVLSRYQPMIRRLRDYFLGLVSAGKLRRLEIGPSP
jgi:phosphatidylserine/phosphatidylglycerophosphate/cardiolipin synthase-like enzyme